MKINLPVFKDKDAKDVGTYQSWRRDLMVYRCAGCRDHTLPPYTIRSFQGYPARASIELQYGYNLGQCDDNLGRTLQQCESMLDVLNQGAIPTTDGG